jgi:hypothetical protein
MWLLNFYASLGQTGSTMESDALNNNSTQAQALTFRILQQVTQQGSQLISTALQGLGLSGQAYSSAGKIYSSLMETQMKQDQSVLSSIGNFANALGNVFGKVAPAAIAAL